MIAPGRAETTIDDSHWLDQPSALAPPRANFLNNITLALRSFVITAVDTLCWHSWKVFPFVQEFSHLQNLYYVLLAFAYDSTVWFSLFYTPSSSWKHPVMAYVHSNCYCLNSLS